ncbi:carboxypeptidase-like regulatory domain-containing protein [Sphingomonas sp.]|uniref:carboxypeptidase-like regulatory domain-containing protein n=1 Tax=Sphingomonas sp. TaxID=28214 RepID=UPI001D9009AF|nr:carboxypeptidase-like regulatory domain-containing protein [Sphingomonas sp.]MBX9797104.1 carboxypeptidase-like regulatory domain-containing protein [Sphingomonas sp.]
MSAPWRRGARRPGAWHWPGVRAALALLWLMAGLALAGPVAAQLRTDPDDQLLFDARVGNLQVGNGVRAYNTRAGLCLDFNDVVDALQIAITLDPGGRSARGWAFEESRRIEIDRDKGEARFGNEYAKIGAETIWESRTGWCVLADDLGKWLGLGFDPDVTNAILTIRATGTLPLEAAARRAINAEKLRTRPGDDKPELPRVALPYRAWRMPVIDVNAALAVDRSGTGPITSVQRWEAFAAGELAFLSAEARLSSTPGGAPQAFRLRLYRSDIDAGLLGPLKATEFALGDVMSPSTPLTVQATPGRGASITNRPLGSATRYDLIDFSGPLPRGWDVELYRNGELLRSTTGGAIGRYEFRDVELRFGVNSFELVQYGPQGQVRRERRSYNIGQQAPRPGETWWYAGIVEDRRDLIEFSPPIQAGLRRLGWRADVGVEHGLGSGASLALAGHRVTTPTGAADFFGEASVRASLMSFLAEVNVAQAAQGGTALRLNAFGRVWNTTVSVEAIRNRGLTSERLDASQREVTAITLDRPFRLAGLFLPVRFDLRSTVSRADETLQFQSRMSVATRRVSASVLFGWQQVSPRGGRPVSEAIAGLLFNTRLKGIRLRGEAGWTVAPSFRLNNAIGTANFSLSQKDEVQASLGYAGRGVGPYAALGYTRDLGAVSLTASAQGDSKGGFSLGLGLQFSIGRDGQGRYGKFRSVAQASSGSIRVTAFQDLDGDGRRDADEPVVPVPGLLVNGVPQPMHRTKGQADAAQLLDGFDPARPVAIALDEGAIADPFEVPTSKGVAAIPRAGLVTAVELGITGTSTVDGTLMVGGRPAPGEAIELVDAAGTVAYKLRTEFDGFFTFERVRYGRYTLRLARGGTPLATTRIEVGPDRPAIRLGNVLITDAARLAAK